MPCTVLSYPSTQPAFANWASCARSPLQPCHVTVTSEAQQWSTLPTVTGSLGSGIFTRSNRTGFLVSCRSNPPLARANVAQARTARNEVEGGITPPALRCGRASPITGTRLQRSSRTGSPRMSHPTHDSIVSRVGFPRHKLALWRVWRTLTTSTG